jgi:hypothetical protein
MNLRADDQLSRITQDQEIREPQIICSVGLFAETRP